MQPRTLPEYLASLRPGDHICFFYESQKQMDAIIPLFKQSLAKHYQCLYIADDNSALHITEALNKSGINVAQAVAGGQLSIISKYESYIKNGYFDPQAMISLLEQAILTAQTSGFSGFLATGEMTWALAGHSGSQRLVEYEAKLNNLIPHSQVIAVCQYNLDRFAPELLLDMIKTHPLIIYGGAIYRNFYYIPPTEFLEEQPRPGEQLRRYLGHLKRTEEIERRLGLYAGQLEQKTREVVALNKMFQDHLESYSELKTEYARLLQAIGDLDYWSETGRQSLGVAGDVLHPPLEEAA